jgi:aryl-alcohol dehydrogenase-like predicted oxidoreductase
MRAPKHNRRDFLGKVAAGIAGASVGISVPTSFGAGNGDMPMRALGRSGERVSLIGLGGYHLGSVADEQTAIRLVRQAIDNGVNFMDNCWDYHAGVSETWMGKALRDGYRKKVFLMTKIDGQTKESATRQIEECMGRLQTDVIDLMQFHEVIRPGDPDRIFSPDGAFEAVMAAKKAGKVRYIGFTGHKDPDVHLKMIETGLQHGFTFDAVQLPLNLLDHHYRSFEKKVLPVLVKHGIGVLAMKPLAEGHIFKTNTVTAAEAFHYVMGLPVAVVITGFETTERLNQALDAARTFKALGEKQVASLLAKTAAPAREGKFEPFKTTNDYDGTIHNPQWLG